MFTHLLRFTAAAVVTLAIASVPGLAEARGSGGGGHSSGSSSGHSSSDSSPSS